MCKTENPSLLKRGLVLEGGGAKGAYAFGCLLELKNAGIKFDAIAGSSVGALNAALWAADQLDKGETFWRSLSVRSICKPQRKLLMYLLFPFHLLSILIDSEMRFQSTKGVLIFLRRRLLILFLGLLVPTVSFGFVYLIGFIFGLNISISIKSLLDGISAIWNFLWSMKFPVNSEPLWVLIVGYILLLSLILFNVIFIFLNVVPPIGSLIWRHLKLSLFDTTPLRNSIVNTFAGCELDIPTYATLAKSKLVFDPDKPFLQLMTADNLTLGWFDACEYEISIPFYERLDYHIKSKRFSDLLVASTALPLGLFPSVIIDNEEFMDGGMGDNLPIWPLLELEGCNELWIIRLQPEKNKSVVNHWRNVDRNLRICELSINKARLMFEAIFGKPPYSTMLSRKSIDPPINIPYRQFPNDVRVVSIFPEKKLGKFFSGTINFKSKYAQRLMTLGQADAARVIRDLYLL